MDLEPGTPPKNRIRIEYRCSVLSDSLQPHELYSPPGSSVHGILQGRILEWIVIPFSWDLLDQQIKPMSPALQVDALPFDPQGSPGILPYQGGIKCQQILCWVYHLVWEYHFLFDAHVLFCSA